MGVERVLPKLKIADLLADIPIVQGGMAVRISLAPLAAAVANEGGIGLVAASGLHPRELAEHLQEARRLTDGIIGINVMMAAREFHALVETAIRSKVDLVVSGAGFSRDAFSWCREKGVPFVPIVSSARLARVAEKLGAPAVVVESGDAGGHLGTDEPTRTLLPKVIAAVSIPVIAAGGLLNGADIAWAMSQGASGVQLGTRFAASVESSASDDFKEAYVKSRPEDVVLVKSPVGLPGRAVHNKFLDDLDAGLIPRFTDIKRCQRCLRHCNKDYCIIDALVNAQQGDINKGLIFCGARVAEIDEVLPVTEIVSELKAGYREALGRSA